MSFQEIVDTVRNRSEEIDISGVNFLAVQINITDENSGGTFYIEVKDHRVNVEPYEYIDRNCGITLSGENFMKLMAGKLDPVAAYTTGKLKVDGDVGKALEFSKLIESKKSKKK